MNTAGGDASETGNPRPEDSAISEDGGRRTTSTGDRDPPNNDHGLDRSRYRDALVPHLLDLSTRDRTRLLTELDKQLAKVAAGMRAESALGPPQVRAAWLRHDAGLPLHLTWWGRLKRTRFRFKIGLALFVVVAALLASYVTYTTQYALDNGGFFVVGPGYERLSAGDVEEIRLRVAPDCEFGFIFTIRNPGRQAVHIEDVTLTGLPWQSDPPNSFVVDVTDVRQSRVDYSGTDLARRPDVPLRATKLPSHRTLQVWLQMKSNAGSEQGDSGMWFQSARVRFTVLGMHRTQDVPLPVTFGVAFGRAGEPCPRMVA